jgi:hypothetical protein
MQEIAWHHLRTQVPPDWEVGVYSVEDRAGRLEFVTRHGLMAMVSWEPCEREPDRRSTMMSFLQSNILGGRKQRDAVVEGFVGSSVGKFELGWLEDGPCQALAYSPAASKLIRWVFEPIMAEGAGWPRPVEPILRSFDFNDGPRFEVRLHGIKASLPREYHIEDASVLPANVTLTFEHIKNKRRAIFRRWGLPDLLLAGKPLAEFQETVLRAGGCTVQSVKSAEVSGMEACEAVYEAPREHHMDRFMGRRWPNGKAVMWYNRDEKRLYSFEQVGPAKSAELKFEETLPRLKISSVV